MPRQLAQSRPEEIENERGITEIDSVAKVTQVSVPLTGKAEELTELLRKLEAARQRVSLVKIHSGALNFVVEGDLDAARAQRILGRPVKVRSNCATVNLRSPAMRMLHGIMANAVRTLYAKNIAVHATSDAYDRLSLVIDGKHLKSATTMLKRQFDLD